MERNGWDERQAIHDYMGVNYSIVWDVIKNKIPELSEQIVSVIEKR
jgi:uncharacterized protein with HEPN domain